MSLCRSGAADSIGSSPRPTQLHIVRCPSAHANAAPDAAAPAVASPRAGERDLLDQWREAHWTLRLRLQELAQRQHAFGDIEQLYDAARRADNRLTEFYQLRAEHLARKLRAALIAAAPGSPSHTTCGEVVDDEERALVGYFRALGAEDRASLLRLASRLGDDGRHRPVTTPRRPTP